jgi:hypothetical protein
MQRRCRRRITLVAVGILIPITFATACSTDNAQDLLAIGQQAPSKCPRPSSENYFFPVRTFASAEYDGAGLQKQLSSFLDLMSEPSLSCGEEPDEAYRMLNYFPFWGPPNPVAIRITRVNSQRDLVTVSLAGGRDTGLSLSVSHRAQKALGSEDWTAFIATVEKAGFWVVPLRPPTQTVAVLDGATWIVEGRRGGTYRVLPLSFERPALVEMSRTFFSLAGLDVPPELMNR